MQNRLKTLALVVLALAVATSAFAQTGTTGRGGRTGRVTNYTVEVVANVRNATVFIDGDRQSDTTPSTFTLAGGSYEFRVEARGYLPWEETVTIDSDMTLEVDLEQEAFPVRVRANVDDARVFVDGEPMGETPVTFDLPGGRYQMLVEAEGFVPFETSLFVNGEESVFAELEPVLFPVRIRVSNTDEAMVYVNEEEFGNAPVSIELPEGYHYVFIYAPGFQPFEDTIMVNGTENINVTLEPMMARLFLNIPEEFLNQREGNPMGQIQLWIDGRRINAGDFREGMVEIEPGMHEVEIISGGLRVRDAVPFEPGAEYFVGVALEFLLDMGMEGM